jgi:hypothetical protein
MKQPVDTSTSTWRRVKEFAEGERTEALKKVQRTGLDLAGTEYQRGRVAAFDAILSLGNAAAQELPVRPSRLADGS